MPEVVQDIVIANSLIVHAEEDIPELFSGHRIRLQPAPQWRFR